MRRVLVLEAPANILLVGEYAITEEGGRGISVAVAPRARAELRVTPGLPVQKIPEIFKELGAGALRITARMGAGSCIREEDAPGLCAAVCGTEVSAPGAGDTETPLHLVIDTTAFFDPRDGSKRGFGSSAVATLLAVATVEALRGIDPIAERNRIMNTAIDLHRQIQNGRGSGYDVATSTLGGVVLFTGGIHPSARSGGLSDLLENADGELYTLAVGKPVNSAAAVRRFEEFVDRETREHFLQRTNTLVREMENATQWCDLFGLVGSARQLSEEIGETIGVHAELPFNTSHLDDGWIAKTSGAGNERAILLARRNPRRPLPPGSEQLEIDRRGLSRQKLPPWLDPTAVIGDTRG